jgi:group I intron endonuclease
MYICRSLLKHGYPNFSLTILEYCEPSKCLEREGYYFQLLKPEYNTAKKPGAPMSGRTHSDESRQIMSDAKIGENNPMFGKNHSEETRQQIEVTDSELNITTNYNSISEATRAWPASLLRRAKY